MKTDRKGNIYFADGSQTGWSVFKEDGKWFFIDFDGEKSKAFTTKSEAMATTGLDWE